MAGGLMRTCAWCKEPIQEVELVHYGTFWLREGSVAEGSAVCAARMTNTLHLDEAHEPVPFDLPPSTSRTDLERWLEA